jgi:hypothetical protein
MSDVCASLVAALPDLTYVQAGWIADDTQEHDPQHAAQVRAWRRRRIADLRQDSEGECG